MNLQKAFWSFLSKSHAFSAAEQIDRLELQTQICELNQKSKTRDEKLEKKKGPHCWRPSNAFCQVSLWNIQKEESLLDTVGLFIHRL